jgi:DNA-binding winged helix-turn-helix (wHTH) protein/tetratricopeptide (TPR) repeat protein
MDMASETSSNARFVRLGPFIVDGSSGEVQKNGQRVRIPDQPTRLLLALLEKPGEIVSREELRAKLWSNDTNVEFDHGIHAAINKLRQALGDSPEQPKFIETVPRHGYRLIASVTAVIAPVGAEHTPAIARLTPPPPWRSKNALFLTGTVSLTLVVLISALLHFKSKPRFQSNSVRNSALFSPITRRIAIVGFRNLSDRKESDWLSTAFSEMLATELGTSVDLQPVSGADVVQMKRELAIGDGDSFTQQTLHKIQQNLGAELVLAGSFMPIGRGNPRDRVRFDIHLLNTNTGQTVASLSETGTVGDLFDLISDAGLRLRLALGVTPLSSSEQAEIRHSMPTSGAAQDLYFSGLEKIREFDYKGAREVLTRAVASDAKSSLVHEALSIALSASGYESQAAKEAQLAFELAKGLTYEQGLQVEGRYHETKHAWARAEEIYQRLCSFSPGSIDFALRLAHVQTLDGKPNDAMATLERLRAFSRAARDNAEIDLAEASVRQEAGDSKRELAAAQAAAAQGEQANAPLVIARALRMQGVALGYLGESTQALNVEHQAERIFETLQDPGGLIDTLIDDGDIQSDLGDMSAAETTWRKALVITRSTGSKLKEAVVSNNLGNALLTRGEPEQARTLYQQSYKLFLETDYKTGQATSLLTTGDALQNEGRLKEAQKYYEQALQLSMEIANQEVTAEALEALAGNLADLGESGQAKRIAKQAIAAAQVSGDKLTEDAGWIYLSQAIAAQGALAEAQSTVQKAAANADVLGVKTLQAASRRVLAQIQALQGDTGKARANLEQALTLAESAKDSTEEREIRYALAELAFEEQRPRDARDLLRRLQAELKHSQNVDAELECLILQTELELSDKQNDAALSIALRAQSVSGHDDRFDLKMSAAEVLVKAAAASRKWTQADQAVSSALLRASQSTCVACRLRAAFSECDLKAAENMPDAYPCFAKLQSMAESKGFEQIGKSAALRSHVDFGR